MNMETAVCYRHKERELLIDMKYLKEHLGKTITFVDWSNPFERCEYKVEEIPFSEDWEIELRYFKPEEVSKLLNYNNYVDRELEEKIHRVIDYSCRRNLDEK